MSDLEFKSWREIEKYQGVHVIITEKIHGTNAQIHVYSESEGAPLKARAGSRNRYLDVLGSDNYGFAVYVKAHEQEICEKLGEGRHYGEWVGPGINGEYGLPDKHLVLFDHKRHPKEKFDAGQMPPRMLPIPVLYDGPYSIEAVQATLEKLRTEGSVLSPGFMKPEGVVLHFPQFNSMKKRVFKAEETPWKAPKPKPPQLDAKDLAGLAAPFLQPIRLEKLLMREEAYRAEYPKSLPKISGDYIRDLLKETPDMTEEQITAVKRNVFHFIKSEMDGDE